MKCPKCGSIEVNKNGHCRGKQNYRCKSCGRQFLEFHSTKGYSNDARQICLKMVRDGLGFRAIERATGVSHNTIINWVKQAEADLSDTIEADEQDDQRCPARSTALQSCAVNSAFKKPAQPLLQKFFNSRLNMNLDSTPSPTVITIEVQYSDYPSEAASQRWHIYHRLRELEISCRCAAHQPLTVQVNGAIAAFQLWSVVKQVSTSRLELVDWLERCWRLR